MEPDAALRVLWPSADELSAARLGAAGFGQRGVFALRPAGALPRVRGDAARAGTVRRAGPDDLDAAFALHREENEFLRGVGLAQGATGTGGRASYERMAAGLAGDGPSAVHLVDVAGRPVAVCESWPVEVTGAGATGGHSAGWLLPPGRYTYLHSVGVTASQRGRGLGALLVAGVLDDLGDAAVDGTFLWYEAGNPLASGFWHAMGYRSLWTAHQRPVQP